MSQNTCYRLWHLGARGRNGTILW